MSLEEEPETVLVDASMLDGLSPEEYAFFMDIFGRQEVLRAEQKRADALEYQGDLAETLMEHAPRFKELDCSADSVEWAALELASSYPKPQTVHRFYRNLYGIEPNMEHGDGEDAETVIMHFSTDERIEPVSVSGRFGDLPVSKSILVNHRDRDWPFVRYRNYGEFLRAISSGEMSFIYTGCFWSPERNGEAFLTARRAAMTSIGAFVVDLDRCESEKGEHYSADWVMRTLVEYLDEYPQLEPSYISLTGTGIQLWYVFGRQIPLLSRKSPRRDKYDKVVKLLYGWFAEHLPRNRFVVDEPCATICHAFRAPGSDAKLHYPTRMFVNDEHEVADPLAISQFLNGPLEPYDVENWDEEAYRRMREERADKRQMPATEKQLAYLAKLEKMGCIEPVFGELTIGEADEEIKRGEIVYTRHAQAIDVSRIQTAAGRSIARRPRDPKLYEYTLERLRRDTYPGTRYNALFGLAGLAWNCGIPKSRLRRDMEGLLDTDMGRKLAKDGKPLQMSDVKAAMTGYNALGALRPRAMLEKRLGWKYAPPQKRNGRTRRDHLWADWYIEDASGTKKRVVNTARENRRFASEKSRECAAQAKREAAVGKLVAFLAENPTASKRAASKTLKMSLSTVTKYWSEACEQAGVEDTRTGNHKPS